MCFIIFLPSGISYLNLYSFPKENVLNYEKTPTYYKSIRAQSRIQAMNSTIKLVNIGKLTLFDPIWPEAIWIRTNILVCDNVRRTLSRFLHIQHGVATKKFTPVKLKGLGHTLETFNDNLRKTIKPLKKSVKVTMERFIVQDEGSQVIKG